MCVNLPQDQCVLHERLRSLEAQVTRQQRLGLALVVTVFAFAASGFIRQPPAKARPAAERFATATIDSLVVRQLVVLDASGVPRAMLGAPLPEPIMLGKRFRRRGAVSGLLLYDSEGNERGGYVTGDSGRGAALTLDEINRAAVHLGVNERGEMHLTLSNGQGHWSGLGITPRGSYLQLGTSGKVVFDATDSTRRTP